MSSSTRTCFNRFCKEAKSDQLRRGWRLRNGDFAQLCYRCGAAFEEGRFCDTFHVAAAGWRNCESCGKRVHCGCIVSIYAYILLDAGGVNCMACTRRNIIMATNQIWPPFSSSLPLPDRLKDLSVKNQNQIAEPSKVLGQWVRPYNMWNASPSQSGLNPRMQHDVDGVKLTSGECSTSIVEMKRRQDPFDRLSNLNHAVVDSLTSVNTAVNLVSGSHSLRRNEMSINCLQGMAFEAHPDARHISLCSSSLKEDRSNPHIAAVPYPLPNEANGLNSDQGGQPQQQTSSLPVAKQFTPSFQNAMDSSDETPEDIGRLQADGRGRSQLLPQYRPQRTNKTSEPASGDSNSVITPLFEKMLSASDAGRVGRLVLPKRYAEAYFPTITQSDGLPLKIQDAKGKEWLLHFRFWPNNNSRMYVLEGITPCIQSMELQAGDIVTFSRIDPEGKLVMGFRKAASIPPSYQDKRSLKAGSNVSKNSEVNNADPSGSWSKNDTSGYRAKDMTDIKSFTPSTKRKSRGLGAKGKRLRIDQEDIMELKLTCEEAQGLLRPPLNHVHHVMFVEGHPFEEYEEAPILGKPTIFSTDQVGEKIQWTQCEDCLKWRKLPISALLPSRWTCSANLWDPERSSCSSVQEVTAKELEDILSSNKTGMNTSGH